MKFVTTIHWVKVGCLSQEVSQFRNRFTIVIVLLVGKRAQSDTGRAQNKKHRAGKKMSINPNPENSVLDRLEKASIFIVFVIAAAVLVAATGIILDQTVTPNNALYY